MPLMQGIIITASTTLYQVFGAMKIVLAIIVANEDFYHVHVMHLVMIAYIKWMHRNYFLSFNQGLKYFDLYLPAHSTTPCPKKVVKCGKSRTFLLFPKVTLHFVYEVLAFHGKSWYFILLSCFRVWEIRTRKKRRSRPLRTLQRR